MNAVLLLQCALLASGVSFFLIGTVGLLRMPDTYTRIHALTKVDNLGLGLIVAGLLPGVSSIMVGLKLILIWLLALGASATVSHLVAHARYRNDASASDNAATPPGEW